MLRHFACSRNRPPGPCRSTVGADDKRFLGGAVKLSGLRNLFWLWSQGVGACARQKRGIAVIALRQTMGFARKLRPLGKATNFFSRLESRFYKLCKIARNYLCLHKKLPQKKSLEFLSLYAEEKEIRSTDNCLPYVLRDRKRVIEMFSRIKNRLHYVYAPSRVKKMKHQFLVLFVSKRTSAQILLY